MAHLADIDFAIFHWINAGWSNAVFDVVLPLCREKWFWAPLYLFIVALILVNHTASKAAILLGGIVLTIFLTDFLSSEAIKKNVRRLRPCNDERLEYKIIERVNCGGGYSFTSSHAANHFGFAVFIIGIFGGTRRRIKPFLLGWATLIAVSQVYVGVHYPSDVAAGALLGAGVAAAVLQISAIRRAANV